MGQSQICGQSTTTTNSNFSEAEKLAFDRASQALSAMPFASLADLEQAATSYYAEGFRLAGVSVSGEYVQRKGAKLAAWWHTKHTASRQVRPHTKYSASQALRGRQVAAIRKRGRTNWTALRVQLERDRGAKVAEVAGELGCSTRQIYKLSRRRFPRLVLVVLVLALGGVNVPKSSVRFPSEFQGINQKEHLPAFTLADGSPAHPPPLGKIDEKPPPSADIVAELGALYPQWASDLEELAS